MAAIGTINRLALAQEAREKLFAAIVRFVRRREASGPAKDMMAQIRCDHQLCNLLVGYETESEIIGIMELMRCRKMRLTSRTLNPSGTPVRPLQWPSATSFTPM